MVGYEFRGVKHSFYAPGPRILPFFDGTALAELGVLVFYLRNSVLDSLVLVQNGLVLVYYMSDDLLGAVVMMLYRREKWLSILAVGLNDLFALSKFALPKISIGGHLKDG